MSTYIPGVTDYVPEIQPFKPDFNFYAGALQMKQGQYDSSHKQLSNLYGSLLNAPMLRDNNIQARDDYFKAIDTEIKKVSGMDLSKQENVSAASEIFTGLYENDNIVKDMVWTRNYQGELRRAEGFRSCVDPEKCGGAYWEGGVKALNYKADEFRKATDQQAMGFSNVNYTPYQNVMEKAIKAANDAGLSISVDQLQGRYITTTKNGPMLIDPLNSLFTGLFGNDPAIMDYYKTKAYVDRKDWVQSNVPVYGSEAGAESAYLENMTYGMEAMFNNAKEDVDSKYNNINGQRKQLEEKIERDGTSPNSSLADQYRELNNLEGQVVSSQESIDNANAVFGMAMDPAMRSQMAENMDSAMANILLAGDIGNAAQTLAYKDYEYSMKADPYALENVKQSNRLSLENTKFNNRKLLEKFKYDLEAWEEKKAAQGGQLENVPIVKAIIEGGADINLEEGGAYNMYKDKEGNLVKDLSGGEKSILSEMMNLTQLKSKNENGKGIATDDLVAFGDILFRELADSEAVFHTGSEYISNNQITLDNKRLQEKWSNMTYDQKVKYAQDQDFTTLVQKKGISGTVLDNVYNEFALPMMDQNNQSNRVNRDYLGNLWATSEGTRKDIEVKNHLLTDMGKWYTNETQNVIQNMKATEEYAGIAPIMQMYIDSETGRKRSGSEFATLYANQLSDVKGRLVERDLNWGGTKDVSRLSQYDQDYNFAMGLYEGSVDVADINVDLDMSLDEIWASGFSKFMNPEGGALALGLIGSDSNAAMGLQFPVVDPTQYASGATMNTMSFMNDVFGAGEGAKFTLGGPASELPEGTDANIEAFFGQLYTDMLTRKDPKDKKRPILDVTYQDIAGGSEDWTALNIKVNSPYVTQFLGSEKTPGMTRSTYDDLSQDGFTVYLNKNNANNGFRQAVTKSPIEQSMFYTGGYSFDSYPEYTQDLNLKTDPNGGYILSGNVMGGVDPETGAPTWKPVYVPATQLGTDPTLVVQGINDWLETQIVLGNKTMVDKYNNENGVKDPAVLLNR
jgi:hypothetical protein